MAQVGFPPATDVAFGIVFGLFVLALLVLAVVTIRWGVRRDRPGRQAWRQSRIEAGAKGNVTAPFGSGRTAGQDPAKDL
jgi:membrane protein implicated in regulation of membrane protease activity